MSYSVQKMCHALFIPFLGRSASGLFCLSEEQITQKSWVDPSSPESRMPLRYSHDRDQICHSLLKENLSRSPRQASRCCLWGRKLWGVMMVCRWAVCLMPMLFQCPAQKGDQSSPALRPTRCWTETWECRGLTCIPLWTGWHEKHTCWGGTLCICH